LCHPALFGPKLYRDPVGRYYLLVKRAGKQFRRSLKTTDPALAKRRLREFLERAGQLSTDGTSSSIRFEDLAQRWLAAKTAKLKASLAYRRASVLKQLTPFFKGRLVRANLKLGKFSVEQGFPHRAGISMSKR